MTTEHCKYIYMLNKEGKNRPALRKMLSVSLEKRLKHNYHMVAVYGKLRRMKKHYRRCGILLQVRGHRGATAAVAIYHFGGKMAPTPTHPQYRSSA